MLDASGIYVTGGNLRVLDNDVINIFAGGSGTARGILIGDGFSNSNALAVNNRITGVARGIEFPGNGEGKYRDNLTFDVTTPFTGGTDAGNNN